MNIIKDIVDGVRFFVAKKSKTSLPDDFETSGIGREEHMKDILDEVVKQLKSTEKLTFEKPAMLLRKKGSDNGLA